MGMIIQPSRFAVVGGGSGLSNRWRFNFTAKQGGSAWVGIREVEMRESVGGADQCTGGSASASHNNGGANPASNAFDDNTSTHWTTGTTSMPVQLEYQFSSNETINEVLIRSYAADDSPTAFDVQYYDGSTWVTHFSETSTNWGGSDWVRTFAKYDALTAGFFKWRLAITSTRAGGAAWAAISELQFRTSAGGADATSPLSSSNAGDIFGSNNNFTNAFDDNTGTIWQSGFAPSGGSPGLIGYRFPTQTVINEVSIRNTGTLGDSPKAVNVQYYDPASATWVTSWSITDCAFSTTNETLVFTKP